MKAYMMDLHATVIIPTFENWDGLQLCLDCLAGQSADPSLFEIIVANNNASPDVPLSLRLPSNARVIHAAKPGSYAARNVALAEARGAVLFFTDSDCQPDRRWIDAGLEGISRLDLHGRIAGEVVLFPAAEHWTAPELYDRIFSLRQSSFVQLGWCATANLVTRSAAFDQVGPFSEEAFSGGDREWGMRANDLGSELAFCPEVLIRHPTRASYAELIKRRRRLIGGVHHDVRQGRSRYISLRAYLSFISYGQIRTIMSFPGLTDGQRLQVMGVCFYLGFITFVEIVRLRYLSGKPERS